MNAQAGAIDIPLVIEHAMQADVAPRVLASMGFDRFMGPLPRVGIAAFDKGYTRVNQAVAAAVRAQYGEGQAALWAEARRAEAAERNRRLGDHPVMLLVWERDKAAVWLDMVSGEWRDTTGGQVGEDIISLGAVMWQCRLGQAAFRCARIAGLGALPHVSHR